MSETLPENMTLSVDHEKRRIFFAQGGLLDKERILKSYRIIFEHDGIEPDYDTIADYRMISEISVGHQDFKEIITEVKKLEFRTGKGALVVGDDLGRRLLAKVFCEFNVIFGPGKIRWKHFRSVAQAEDWLNSGK